MFSLILLMYKYKSCNKFIKFSYKIRINQYKLIKNKLVKGLSPKMITLCLFYIELTLLLITM